MRNLKFALVLGLATGCHRDLNVHPCAHDRSLCADAGQSTGDASPATDSSVDDAEAPTDAAAESATDSATDAGCSKPVCQIRELAAGAEHSCALFKTGKVQCWGKNGYGQIGLPASTTASSKTPVEVPLVEGAVAIVAGEYHTCALLADGRAMCWGDNQYGKLGDGTIRARDGAAPVKDLTDVTAIFAGAAHTCVITKLGSVKCWGRADSGESGAIDETAPLARTVDGVSGPAQLALGRGFSCARKTDGTVSCWGKGTSTPEAVTSLSGVTDLSAKYGHACAVAAGSVKCWGSNLWGALGDGTRDDRLTPTPVTGLTGVTGVVVGELFTCARDAKSAWCWGDNTYGEVGDGTTTDKLVPTPVTGLVGAVHLALGSAHAMALTADKHLVWGANQAGQLGITTVENWATLPSELVW